MYRSDKIGFDRRKCKTRSIIFRVSEDLSLNENIT